MINQEVNFENFYLKKLFKFNYRTLANYNYDRFFDDENLSTVTSNEFVPLINFRVYKDIDDVIIYPKLKRSPNTYKTTIKDFSSNLINYENYGFSFVEFKEGEETRKIYVGYGIVLDENFKILFLAAFRNRLYDEIRGVYVLDLDSLIPISTRDIKIYMSNRFILDYKRFYNRVKREFLDDYLEVGCELTIVKSSVIEDSVYGNEFEMYSNFETIEDKLSFIEEFRNTILEYEQ